METILSEILEELKVLNNSIATIGQDVHELASDSFGVEGQEVANNVLKEVKRIKTLVNNLD